MADDGEHDASGERAHASPEKIIVVQRADPAQDVIETEGSHVRLASLASPMRRRPLASAVSIVAAAPPALTPSPTATACPTIDRLEPSDVPAVDIVVVHELRTTGGDRFDLSWAGLHPRPVMVSGGWLVQGVSSLWYLARSGVAQPLLWQIKETVVGRDGRATWHRADRVGAARLSDGVLVDRHEVDAKGYQPHWIIGDAVVMCMRNSAGFPTSPCDLWRPALGAFEPEPHEIPATPIGPNFAGTALLGVQAAGNGGGCLVEINPETFGVVRQGCVLASEGLGPHAISPDGRWLLLNVSYGSPFGQSVRIDLRSVFSRPVRAELLPGLGVIDLHSVVWLDSSTFVAAASGALRRVDLDNPSVIVELPIAELPRDDSGGADPAYVVPVEKPE